MMDLTLKSRCNDGAWESLANPPGSGPGERRFESGRSDSIEERSDLLPG
jgi:hypothetical protein